MHNSKEWLAKIFTNIWWSRQISRLTNDNLHYCSDLPLCTWEVATSLPIWLNLYAACKNIYLGCDDSYITMSKYGTPPPHLQGLYSYILYLYP